MAEWTDAAAASIVGIGTEPARFTKHGKLRRRVRNFGRRPMYRHRSFPSTLPFARVRVRLQPPLAAASTTRHSDSWRLVCFEGRVTVRSGCCLLRGPVRAFSYREQERKRRKKCRARSCQARGLLRKPEANEKGCVARRAPCDAQGISNPRKPDSTCCD